jgi:SAM-dependent methyltransferase
MRRVDEYIETNRLNWDDRVPIHLVSKFYDVASFKAGRSTLMPVERNEIGDVRGKTLLHLQCHFGMDTLSWAREGSIVTGVDFSGPAIEAARSLANELQIDARFVESDVYKLPTVLSGSFDIVFASYGVLCWLPDLPAWFRIAADYLNPGGVFYIIDGHPIADMLADDEIKMTFPYQGSQALPSESDDTYTDQQSPVEHTLIYEFSHGVGEIIGSAVDAGLEIEFFHEFTEGFWPRLPQMQKRDDGFYELPDNRLELPFMFSLRARKPAKPRR